MIHKNIYWLSDTIKGRKVRKHYEEIENSLKRHRNLDSHQNYYLQLLLKHAKRDVPFYMHLNENATINEFPLVNKNIIRNNFEKFRSASYLKEPFIKRTTSGSTGTPFTIYQNINKKLRNNADTIYFAKLAGYEIGDKLYYLKIWQEQKLKNPLYFFLHNIVPVDVIKLDYPKISELILKIERNKAPCGILGYSSALEQVCKYLDSECPDKSFGNVKSVISISESLNDYIKETTKKYFGVTALSRYSNLENGIIAQQEPNNEYRYLINTASYYVEIFRMDSDEPSDCGEMGRIVVTDLFNYSMPLIRYDTGDVGAIISDKEDAGRIYFSAIEGRKLDLLYDTEGNLVSSYIVYKNMWQYTEIKQYQLIQNGEKTYLFKINIDGAFLREEQLIKEFKTYLGTDADFSIEYVTEIPLLNSGKRRKIVNNYKKP
jgi:phenylacetate-CoA ligase